MRVGIVTPRLLDRPTGIVTYTRELVLALRGLASPPEIILINRGRSDSAPEWFSDFEVHGVGSDSGGGLRPLPWRLAAVAQSLSLDIIHATGNVAPFLPAASRAKRIVTVHDVGPLVYPQQRSLKERIVHATLIPPLRHLVDAVITDSEASARDIVQFAGIPAGMIDVVHLGTTVRESQDGVVDPSDARLCFLAVGDVAVHKNLRGVIAAFRIVRQSVPQARLMIAGKLGFGGDEVRAAAADLGDSVSLLGYVDDAELADLYRRATALVFPSLHEGFGLPVLEAMAGGLPVVTSNRSSLPEVAGDAASLVDPLRPVEIAEAMIRIAHDGALAGDLRARGLARAELFTWQKTAVETLDVYRAVQAGSGARALPPWASNVQPADSLGRTWFVAGVRAVRGSRGSS